MKGNNPVVLHTRGVTATGGGPEKTILSSPRHLIPHGYDALCAYMHPPGDPGFDEIRARADAVGAPLLGFEDRGPLDFRLVRQLLQLCRTRNVSIWHGHDYKSNTIGFLLRRYWSMKLVATAHGWGVHSWKTPLYHGVERFCLRRFDKVICVSDDIHKTCLASRVNKSMVIDNGIDCEQFSRNATVQDAKRRQGMALDRLQIGAVGRLSAEKDFQGLIRAVDRLINQGLPVHLTIVGEGDQRRSMESLVKDLGRQADVTLTGYRSDTVDLYHAMDVFALSSLREGLPNVLLEAMALEVPVIATKVGGIPRMIEHEKDGLLVAPGDLDGLTQGLEKLLRDETFRRRLAINGRATIENRYSFSARMEKVRSVYDEVLDRAVGVPC